MRYSILKAAINKWSGNEWVKRNEWMGDEWMNKQLSEQMSMNERKIKECTKQYVNVNEWMNKIIFETLRSPKL